MREFRVPAETLIARLWDDDPPAAARRAVHAHIARIRRLLRTTGDDGALASASGQPLIVISGTTGVGKPNPGI